MHTKINFKLINICIFVLTCFLIYKSSGLWISIIHIVSKILTPFFLGFLFAYAINPSVKFLEKKGLSKPLSIIIIILIIIGLIAILIFSLIPLLFNQLNSLFGEIFIFIKHISVKFNLDVSLIEKTISHSFNTILTNMYEYVTDFTFKFVNVVTNYFSLIVVFISSSIYFLIDMDKLRNNFKKILINKKIYDLFYNIDKQLKKYYKSFFTIMFITLFEYGIGFFVIGHPNFLLLGILASLASFIPCFGGILINILASITAFVISTKLFIRTLILFCILSFLDSYVINPIIYDKANKVPPIVSIFATFAGGILFNLVGIIMALPLTIVILTTYRFFKKDIYDKIRKGMKKYKEE